MRVRWWVVLAVVALVSIVGSTAGGPKRVKGFVCDLDETTGVCVAWSEISIRPEELGQGLSHWDSLRQLDAAVDSLRISQPQIGDSKREAKPKRPECKLGDIGCGCLTAYKPTPNVLWCDGPCVNCFAR